MLTIPGQAEGSHDRTSSHVALPTSWGAGRSEYFVQDPLDGLPSQGCAAADRRRTRGALGTELRRPARTTIELIPSRGAKPCCDPACRVMTGQGWAPANVHCVEDSRQRTGLNRPSPPAGIARRGTVPGGADPAISAHTGFTSGYGATNMRNMEPIVCAMPPIMPATVRAGRCSPGLSLASPTRRRRFSE